MRPGLNSLCLFYFAFTIELLFIFFKDKCFFLILLHPEVKKFFVYSLKLLFGVDCGLLFAFGSCSCIQLVNLVCKDIWFCAVFLHRNMQLWHFFSSFADITGVWLVVSIKKCIFVSVEGIVWGKFVL